MPRPIAPAFDLVVFDCDGVLVDSEVLSAEVLTALLQENGIAIDADIFRADFLGRTFASASQRLFQRMGKTLPDDFQDRYLAELLQVFSKDLKAMRGVETVLGQLSVKSCVASSSNPRRLAHSLACSGLAPWFGAHVFSGALVEHPKPAPDLFLLAAERMNANTERCLVIEDSDMGLQAARAAGMTVWHFTGGSHFRDGTVGPANTCDGVARDMAELLDMLQAAGLCKS